MKFSSRRDYNTILNINQELVNRVIDVNVIIYKMNQAESETNVYGEATSKVKYTPVRVPALIDRSLTVVDNSLGTFDIEQTVTYAFLRKELVEREMYPQEGDIIYFDSQFYEIFNTNEIQLWAGQESYNHAVLCDTHLARKNTLDIDEPLL